MKTIIEDWDFDHTTGQFVLTELDEVVLRRVLMIIHQPTNTMVYNLADPSTPVLTLTAPLTIQTAFDTSSFSDSDEFIIFYEDPTLDLDRTAEGASDVQAVSLVGSFGETIDTIQGGLETWVVNAGDVLKPPGNVGQNASLTAGNFWSTRWVDQKIGAIGRSPIYDVGNYRGVTVQCVSPGIGGAGWAWFGSNEPGGPWTNFSLSPVTQAGILSGGAASTGPSASVGLWSGDIRFRYFMMSTGGPLVSPAVLSFLFTALPHGTAIPPGSGSNLGILGDAASYSGNGLFVNAFGRIQNAIGSADQIRSVLAASAAAGTGVQAVGPFIQFDDQNIPIAENAYGEQRATRFRAGHVSLRDHSSDTGARVHSGRESLQVEDVRGLVVDGEPAKATSPGVLGVALLDPLGDPISTKQGALPVILTQDNQLTRWPFVGDPSKAADVIDTAPGVLLSIRGTNANASARYLQLFNSGSAPTAGAFPSMSFLIEAGTAAAPSTVSIGSDILGVDGLRLNAGIAWGFSTTLNTYTPATAADHSVTGTYR